MSLCFFFFKQKTAYEMRISDWSSDVCSSDLPPPDHYPEANRGRRGATGAGGRGRAPRGRLGPGGEPAHARAVLVGSAARWGGDHEGPRAGRSEERRGGKECVSQGRSR